MHFVVEASKSCDKSTADTLSRANIAHSLNELVSSFDPKLTSGCRPIYLFQEETSLQYMKGVNMMFLGGLMMAIGVENSGLHRRVALAVLKVNILAMSCNTVHSKPLIK